MMTRDGDAEHHGQFDVHASAAGWVDHVTLLNASETVLFRFDLQTGDRANLIALDAENPVTRSNDGRADPWGGFWIRTMGKGAEHAAGAIYRFYNGAVEPLFDKITVPNAICFAPDQNCAYFTDTVTHKIMYRPLAKDGWTQGPARHLANWTCERIM